MKEEQIETLRKMAANCPEGRDHAALEAAIAERVKAVCIHQIPRTEFCPSCNAIGIKPLPAPQPEPAQEYADGEALFLAADNMAFPGHPSRPRPRQAALIPLFNLILTQP